LRFPGRRGGAPGTGQQAGGEQGARGIEGQRGVERGQTQTVQGQVGDADARPVVQQQVTRGQHQRPFLGGDGDGAGPGERGGRRQAEQAHAQRQRGGAGKGHADKSQPRDPARLVVDHREVHPVLGCERLGIGAARADGDPHDLEVLLGAQLRDPRDRLGNRSRFGRDGRVEEVDDQPLADQRGDVEALVATRIDSLRFPSSAPFEDRTPDGRVYQVQRRLVEAGGVVTVITDITAQKRAERAVLDAKQRTDEANALVTEKNAMLEGLSAKLAKYLSPQIYKSIFSGSQNVEIASKRKKLTVFFSDIAAFTETTDNLESEELTGVLNHYLTEMSRIALEHGATIDKYIGDAMLLFFGDPDTKGVKEDAKACVMMAIAMQRRMRELEQEWRDRGLERPFRIRMGISTGFCTVGNFGSDDRVDYTIIGNVSGKGHHGVREAHFLFSEQESLEMIMTVVPEEKVEPILAGLRPLFERHSGVMFVTDVAVSRQEYFGKQ